jgi:hypothetical protein
MSKRLKDAFETKGIVSKTANVSAIGYSVSYDLRMLWHKRTVRLLGFGFVDSVNSGIHTSVAQQIKRTAFRRPT